MKELLSNLKDRCHSEGLELLRSEILDDGVRLVCESNGRRDMQLITTVSPNGSGKYKVNSVSPSGDFNKELELTEEQIAPAIIAMASNPDADLEEAISNVVENPVDENLMDELTLEVEDDVFDTKVVPSGTYSNSRYAYSDKYHKMGTIVKCRRITK